jgi:citrate synthase
MKIGLDDVVAAETALSDVDGVAGRLIIRGHSLDELAGAARYEDILDLLWSGFFDARPRAEDIVRALGQARVEVSERLAGRRAETLGLPVFDAMRALVAELDDGDHVATALRLVAAPAVFAPAFIRLNRSEAPLAPDASLSHAADVLRMLRGAKAKPDEIAALDAYLVTVSDHGLNASTFAARVVASTHAGLTSSALAALSALKGPLHGGAPGPVLDMLMEIKTADRAEPWIRNEIAQGRRIMGFGHRVYKVRDPRAEVLSRVAEKMQGAQLENRQLFELARSVEQTALRVLAEVKPGRNLRTNVEFYTALVLQAVGLEPTQFVAMFACGRVAGWCAHVIEQHAEDHLIRPQSEYIGPIGLKMDH